MRPNEKNFCGGNFADWLEVMLLSECNGRCPWCIEKDGYHPPGHVSCVELIHCILETGKKHIILLGGEPTLYRDLSVLIGTLTREGRHVYLTTNGSLLTSSFIRNCLLDLAGINVSIHNYDLTKHLKMTGIAICENKLKEAIASFHSTTIRLNCNLIRGHIDSYDQIMAYIEFAKRIGANSIRFAELKNDPENFVNMAEIFGNQYGINNEPFGLGCQRDVILNGMPVNFRQMCGLQTPHRIAPINPEQVIKQVLYYDGHIYNGWQKGRAIMTPDEDRRKILEQLRDGKITLDEAEKKIKQLGKDNKLLEEMGSGCYY